MVPTFLKTKMFIDFSRTSQFDFAFDELRRTIHKKPLQEKPPIGNNPFKTIEMGNESIHIGIKTLMEELIRCYEELDEDDFYTADLKINLGTSRIYTEQIITEAIELKLVEGDPTDCINLTEKGKFYALENNLVENKITND